MPSVTEILDQQGQPIRPTWLVFVELSTDDKISIAVSHRDQVAKDFDWQAHSIHEVVLSGENWKPLVLEAVEIMKQRSGGAPVDIHPAGVQVYPAVYASSGRRLEDEISVFVLENFYTKALEDDGENAYKLAYAEIINKYMKDQKLMN